MKKLEHFLTSDNAGSRTSTQAKKTRVQFFGEQNKTHDRSTNILAETDAEEIKTKSGARKHAFKSGMLNSEVSDSNVQDLAQSSYAESQPSTRDGETAKDLSL